MKFLRKSPILNLKKNAYPFQQEAFDQIKDNEYFAIFHEQGLGKTKIAIDLTYFWLGEEQVDSVLIVTKKSLIKNWQDEFIIHGNLHPIVLGVDKAEALEKMFSPGFIYLTHFESVRNNLKAFKSFFNFRSAAIILDESTQIKNPKSQTAKAFHAIAPDAKKRIIMTGTPISNRPYDIWSQIYFLDFGQRLGKSFADFKEDYDINNSLSKSYSDQIIFKNALNALREMLADCSVRETKKTAGIELPGKKYVVEYVNLETKQQILYSKLQRELYASVIQDGKLVEEDVEVILKRLLRLVQIASNPFLVDESYSGSASKLEPLRKIVSKVRSEKSKIIIWTNFIGNVDWLCEQLNLRGCVGIHGGVDVKQRDKLISKFRTDPDVDILITTPGVAREGLTLVEANHSVFFDRNFSLENYLQAQDRIYRISQKKECFIYKIIARNSIDEWVDALLAAKEIAARYAQGDISKEEYENEMSFDFAELLADVLST
tara:strand:+ start:2160 stop:3623 length:1464 start_codon:yes stop_codon:yes gene_type:complete